MLDLVQFMKVTELTVVPQCAIIILLCSLAMRETVLSYPKSLHQLFPSSSAFSSSSICNISWAPLVEPNLFSLYRTSKRSVMARWCRRLTTKFSRLPPKRLLAQNCRSFWQFQPISTPQNIRTKLLTLKENRGECFAAKMMRMMYCPTRPLGH